MFDWTKLSAHAMALLALSLVVPDSSEAWGPRWPGACSHHARLMFLACQMDRQDDWLVNLADCVYVTSKEDQWECETDARAMHRESATECAEVREARLDLCDLVGEQRFDIAFEPGDFVDPDDIGDSVDPNPYWPLTAGHTHVVVAESEDDEGESVRELVVATATAETLDVGGIPCRVIRDLAFEETEEDGEIEYEAIEATADWFGQIGPAGEARGVGDEGDVVYCGENTYEIEDGLIDNTDGSFANGTDRAKAGYLMRRYPVIGAGDRQEMATDEAEDYVRYEDLATTPSEAEGGDLPLPLSCAGDCLKTFEFNPRDPGGAEYKYYLPGAGFVLATKLDEDGVPTGETEAVTCVTESLEEALDLGEACGIGNVEALTDALCTWAPGAEWMPEDLCD